MAPHVFMRPGELRSAEWTEFNLERRIWTILAEKTKMRRLPRVPLTDQVVDILRELHPLKRLLAKKLQRLEESLGAAHVELSAVDVATIEAASAKVTIQGARYLEVHEKPVGR